jgi:hypothetical protein
VRLFPSFTSCEIQLRCCCFFLLLPNMEKLIIDLRDGHREVRRACRASLRCSHVKPA